MHDTILVAGGAGFIGSAFVRQTLAAGDSAVVVLDKLTYAGSRENLAAVTRSPRLVFVEGDINDGPLVGHLLATHRCRAVVNFAAESHVDRSITDPAVFVSSNVAGAFHLLEASLAYWRSLNAGEQEQFRFLQVSTDEVYGALGASGSFPEHAPYNPSSPYSASKAAADHFVQAYHRTYGLPTLITAGSNNYGPYQFPEKLIPLMIRNAVRGDALPIYGDGSNVRDWIYVDDHCEAVALVLRAGRVGERYNIAAGAELSNLEVVRAVCREVEAARPGLKHPPCASRVRFVGDRPGHDFRYALDTSKLRGELGWRPATSFEAGLRKTVAWCLRNDAWVESMLSRADRVNPAWRGSDQG